MPDFATARIVAVIVGMAVINFGLRFVPLAVLSRVSFPRPVMRWLSFVPISVMGALVATEVVGVEGVSGSLLTSPPLYAAALGRRCEGARVLQQGEVVEINVQVGGPAALPPFQLRW